MARFFIGRRNFSSPETCRDIKHSRSTAPSSWSTTNIPICQTSLCETGWANQQSPNLSAADPTWHQDGRRATRARDPPHRRRISPAQCSGRHPSSQRYISAFTNSNIDTEQHPLPHSLPLRRRSRHPRPRILPGLPLLLSRHIARQRAGMGAEGQGRWEGEQRGVLEAAGGFVAG